MAKPPQRPNGVTRIISGLSSLHQKIIDDNDLALFKLPHNFPRAAPYRSDIRSFFEKIFSFTNCSPSVYIMAYIYLDRFHSRHPMMVIESSNAHRFILTSVLVAAKFMGELKRGNRHFARLGGISLKEMNYSELSFLYSLNFKLNVTPEVYFDCYDYILRYETCSGSSQAPPRLLCSSCNQQKQAVRPVL